MGKGRGRANRTLSVRGDRRVRTTSVGDVRLPSALLQPKPNRDFPCSLAKDNKDEIKNLIGHYQQFTDYINAQFDRFEERLNDLEKKFENSNLNSTDVATEKILFELEIDKSEGSDDEIFVE